MKFMFDLDVRKRQSKLERTGQGLSLSLTRANLESLRSNLHHTTVWKLRRQKRNPITILSAACDSRRIQKGKNLKWRKYVAALWFLTPSSLTFLHKGMLYWRLDRGCSRILQATTSLVRHLRLRWFVAEFAAPLLKKKNDTFGHLIISEGEIDGSRCKELNTLVAHYRGLYRPFGCKIRGEFPKITRAAKIRKQVSFQTNLKVNSILLRYAWWQNTRCLTRRNCSQATKKVWKRKIFISDEKIPATDRSAWTW